MLWTNKKAVTQRVNAKKTEYSPNLSEFQCRYEPMIYTNYNIRAKQVTYKFACDLMDIQVADRIIEWDRQRVAVNVKKYTEALWKHLEVLMREIWPTEVHEAVTKKTLDIIQSNFDPLLEERMEQSKEYIDSTLLVLMDPREQAKDSVIQMLDAGKIEELDYVMTVDFPNTIAKEERIIYNDIEYEVSWIIPQPYQYRVGLKKSVVNYIANQ
jgi:hypothetical protein